ncbi:hypothetical protein BJD49_gp022 [Acinetobacter phage vB_AbaM_phiAbaA1]|uniref:hypothetical protein n=1 Tax=Acinetobacter phage vB_AbaM_phiAbaA1 TaxID=1605379 RepID=UPI00078C2DA0|nr:hypothetical protein BJD49_gp022 [Acinetobacter phage vB_AbaM_phiAbaA1]AJK27268.1 hypothetical protein phiAbaA1_165 [Acinetobacter phage vB_AbaM_phiAbaA1]
MLLGQATWDKEMITLDEAIQGTTTKKTITIEELQRNVDFFKDGIGNRYQLQLTGDTDECGHDEYALVNIHAAHTVYYVYAHDDITVYTDNEKNICSVFLQRVQYFPYIEKAIML